MTISSRHILQQGPVLGALGRAAVMAMKQRYGNDAPAVESPLPGPTIERVLRPPSVDLIRAYVRHVGGDPAAYRGLIPPHLFPQWGFGLAVRTLEGLSYPMMRVMNAGCTLRVNRPLPSGEPLHVSARLENIDDDGRRALLQQRVVTGTPSAPDAIVADLFALVPLGRSSGNGKGGAKKERPRVPEQVRELGYWRIPADAGLDFAKLTGDFNPVHWVVPYAKAFGFRNVILHGFSTMARAMEGMHRGMFAGDVRALAYLSVRFTRPMTLPARVGLYVRGGEVFVGNAPGGPAYMTGRFSKEPVEDSNGADGANAKEQN